MKSIHFIQKEIAATQSPSQASVSKSLSGYKHLSCFHNKQLPGKPRLTSQRTDNMIHGHHQS